MTVTNSILGCEFPGIGAALPVAGLLAAPTALTRETVALGQGARPLLIKHDETSGALYGGNKVRKLDYILARASERGARQVATFGAVGSHHALATALYARAEGLDAVCFLGHQAATDHVYETLSAHVANETRIVRFGGSYANRLALLRRHFEGRKTWVVPSGGSSWLGVVGFVDAALEFAEQLRGLDGPLPGKLYVANGTMGTVAGLALGLALAGSPVEVQAVRVTSEAYANRDGTYRLMRKASHLLNALDDGFPADLADRARIRFRHGFVGDGYTRPTAESEAAIELAREQLALELENTYTGKAFAALLADAAAPSEEPLAFWNTYNAVPLTGVRDLTLEDTGLPEDFARYFPSASAGESSSADPSGA